MRIVNRLIEYVIITFIVTTCYFSITIPWSLFILGLSEEQFYMYLWQGLLIDLIIAYPVGKFLLYIHPKIKIALRI